eukprot:UN04647
MDCCMKEKEELEKMIATKQFSRGLTDAMSCKERINLLDMRVMMFQAAVGDGKMSLDEYLDLCKGQLEIEKKLIDQVVIIAKWYLSKNKKEESTLYGQIALWIKRRVKWLEEEIENAANIDEDDEEE